MIMTKKIYLIIVLLISITYCNAQCKKLYETESMETIVSSRKKADRLLELFRENAPKVLYSLEDCYYYLIIKASPHNKEYYIALDSLGEIQVLYLLSERTKTAKQKKYEKLLLEAGSIFEPTYYKEVSRSVETRIALGRPSYFVMKDASGKRFGEFCLSTLTVPLPINQALLTYLINRLSEEIHKDTKSVNRVKNKDNPNYGNEGKANSRLAQ